MRLSSGKSSNNGGGTSDSGDKKVDSTRRSERLGKQTPPKPTPFPRKSVRLEQQTTPSPVRRSGRFQTQVSSAEKASSPIDCQKKRGQKKKSVQQVTMESAEVSLGDTDNTAKKKRMNARSYKALFKKQKKLFGVTGGDGQFEKLNQVDSLDNSVSVSQRPEHREIGNLQCGLKETKPLLQGSLASSSKESNEKVLRIDVEPEFAYPGQSFSDKPPGFSVRADIDGSVIGCTNTETVDDVSESPKDLSNNGELQIPMSNCSTSMQKGNISLESGEQVMQPGRESCALPVEVGSSGIVASKESSTLVVEAVSSASASTENDKTNGIGAVCSNSNLVNTKENSVAYSCKTDASKFVEYWVPVPVSNVQLEQYCATLLANTITLCSPLKKDDVGVLPKILMTVQKCCDHPYLVDQSLQPSIMKNFKPLDILDVGIKASGKLQLLDRILPKCRSPKLKVLILYQSFAGSGGIGDILDDYMRQRFGENSYGRLESSLVPSKRQETLNKFNDKGGEQFVLLLEHRARSSSLKLLLVNFVIVFNTECSRLANEIKDLQRMSIAQSKQIKVFRLYSCHTLEEKLLILAKHHKSMNISQSTNRTMSDSLLMWGAKVLFNRLEKFHAEKSTGLSLDSLFDQHCLLDDIVKNFMDKVINKPEDNREHDSIISRAFFNEGVYHMDKLLLGEKEVQPADGEERQLYWKKLLEGQKPWWKFWGPTPSSRKRGIYEENSETATKHQKVVDTRDSASKFHPEVESGGQDAVSKAASDHPTSEDEQASLHNFLKDEMEKLCLVLQLSMNIKQMVGAFLEYVIKNHQVNKEPASILHAFQISLCWAAAKILKENINKRETLMRARDALNFQCTDEEAYSVYERLRALKKTFQQLRRKNSVLLPSLNDGQIFELQKQHDEQILAFHKKKEQEKSQLEVDHQIESAFIRKTYPENISRSMQMQLDNELKKQLQELENSSEVQLEELQTRHSSEKEKWMAKEMFRVTNSNLETEVPSASHNIEKQNPNNVAQDNRTQNLITSGISVTIADNAVDSHVCLEASLCTPLNRVPDELLSINRAGAELATVIEQPEETSQRSPQIQTVVAEEAGGGSASSDTSLCIPVNSVLGELLEIEPGGAVPLTVMEQPEETNQMSHQVLAGSVGGSVSSLRTPVDEVSAVERAGPESVTVVQLGVASQVSSQIPTANAHEVLEIEHAGVEPVEVIERREESSSQNGDPSAIRYTGGSEVGEACTSEMKNSLEVETGDGGGNPVGSHVLGNQNNEPSSVPGPRGFESGNACFSEFETSLQVETGDNPMGSEATGEQNAPPPQPLTELVSLPIIPSSELPQKNVHEKSGTLASDCNKLSVDAVNHVHIERTNSLPASAASVEMVESSMELPHQAVSPNEDTIGMSSIGQMDAGYVCSHQVDGRIASPASAISQVVEESGEHSHQETMVQPPSREIVNPTHCDTHFDLGIGSGTNDGPNAELSAVSQNVTAPILQAESFSRPPNQSLAQSEPNLAIADGPTHRHVHPMHHIGFRNSTLASQGQSLQNELDTLRKESEQLVKRFDSTKSLLKSDCERELEAIRMKYQEKLKETESAFMLEKSQLDLNYKVASMHRTLSEALQIKCSDGRISGNSTMKQGLAAAASPHYIQHMHQVGLQPRLRHPSAATLSSAAHPTTGQQNAFLPVQSYHRSSTFSSTGHPTVGLQNNTSSPMQSHHRSSGPFASVPARPPQISSITPSVGSSRVSGEIRAPAPHLQPYRPPGSSAPRLPPNILVPSQQLTANLPAPSLSSPSVPAHQPFPSIPSQISLRVNPVPQSPSMPHHSSMNQDVGTSQLSETQNGVQHGRNNLSHSVSSMELVMDIGDKAGGHMPSTLQNLAGSGSNADASDLAVNRVSGNVNEGIPTSDAASDVVLLSDDES